MLQGALGCSRLAHLKDFEVVLRFFYKLSDCKVHSLFVAERKTKKQDVSCHLEHLNGRGGNSENQPGIFASSSKTWEFPSAKFHLAASTNEVEV